MAERLTSISGCIVTPDQSALLKRTFRKIVSGIRTSRSARPTPTLTRPGPQPSPRRRGSPPRPGVSRLDIHPVRRGKVGPAQRRRLDARQSGNVGPVQLLHPYRIHPGLTRPPILGVMSESRRYGVSILVLFIAWIIVAQFSDLAVGGVVGVLAGILTWVLTAPRTKGRSS